MSRILEVPYKGAVWLKQAHPSLYRLLKSPFWAVRSVVDRLLGTRLQEAIWQTRHIYKGRSWAEGYCKSVDHPHRAWLVDCIAKYAPIESVLEIGCNTGPNLYLLSKRFPKANLYGIEINRKAVEVGNGWLQQMGIANVRLSVGKADNLTFSSKSVDVIFTDAVLLYVGPDKILNVIREMKRVARRVLIFNEYHQQGPKPSDYVDGNWVYNYEHLFPGANITKLPNGLWGGTEGWNTYGSLIEVIL